MGRRWLALGIALAWGAGCRPAPQPPVEPVRLYVAPGLPGEAVAALASALRVARPTLVPTIDAAELAWLRAPSDAMALGARAAPESAPEGPQVPSEFLDREHRWAPVGALTAVLVATGASSTLRGDLSELAEPRLRGKVALPRLSKGDWPRVVAGLELGYGERGTREWLRSLAGNAPIVAEDDEGVVRLVASGRAEVGLVDSIVAGRAAARHALKILFTDQRGGGSVVVPTALVVLPGAGPGARKLSAWLAGPDAEQLLTHRAIGLLPLRGGTSAPPGLLAVWQLAHVSLDWNELSARETVWRRRLAGWPERNLLPP